MWVVGLHAERLATHPVQQRGSDFHQIPTWRCGTTATDNVPAGSVVAISMFAELFANDRWVCWMLGRLLQIVAMALFLGATVLGPALAAEPSPLPDWVSATVGSYAHPLGVVSLYARCPWAGVFPASAGWSTFAEGANLLNSRTLGRLNKAVAFFNRVADRNTFYTRSEDGRISWRILRPANHYFRKLQNPPQKGEYETSKHFLIRQKKWRAKRWGKISVVVQYERDEGSSSLPTIDFISSTVEYDPDNQRFFVGLNEQGDFERLERRVQYDTVTKKETYDDAVVRFGYSPLGLPGFHLRQIGFRSSPEMARRLHPYLAVVASGKIVAESWPWRNAVTIDVESVEIRNVCTNEVLAKEARVPARK